MTDSDITRQARHAAGAFRKNPAAGKALFDRLLAEHPHDGMVFLERAQAREAVGLFADALADYRQAARLLKFESWAQKARAAVERLEPGQRQQTSSPQVAVPSAELFARATAIFHEREPRAAVYQAASLLLQAALANPERLSPVVAVAALIQSWNFAYYKDVSCDAAHVVDLEFALHSVRHDVAHFRQRDIASFTVEADAAQVQHVFATLESVLGRVGAAKAMHLLAPNFFPLWDNPIAQGYGFTLAAAGRNAETYLAFMQVVQRQVASVRRLLPSRPDALKALDEYNYCRFSKGWI